MPRRVFQDDVTENMMIDEGHVLGREESLNHLTLLQSSQQ